MRPLIRSRRIVFFILTVHILSLAQYSSDQTKSPKEVVKEFWKMDAAGGRLTDEGWRAADRFFVRPIEPPKGKTVCVFDHGFSVSFERIKDDTAEVVVDTPGRVWKIDPKMRLGICGSDQGKEFWVTKLVLTGKHWEFAPDRRTLMEVSGAPEWRLEREGNYVYVTREIAIQYLSQIRDNTTDPIVKRNSERTLAILRQRP
jgi:hypothetical protein